MPYRSLTLFNDKNFITSNQNNAKSECDIHPDTKPKLIGVWSCNSMKNEHDGCCILEC